MQKLIISSVLSFLILSVSAQRNNDGNVSSLEQQPSVFTVPEQRESVTEDPISTPAFSSPSEGTAGGETLGTQDDDPGFPGDGGGNPTQDNTIPLDGGLSVLLAAGLGKGAKSYIRYRKNQKK